MSLLIIKDGLVAADTKHIVGCGDVASSCYQDKIIIDKSGKFAIAYTGHTFNESELIILLNMIRSALPNIDEKWHILKDTIKANKQVSLVVLLKDTYYIPKMATGLRYTDPYISGSDEGIEVLLSEPLSAPELIVYASKFNTWIGGEVTVLDPKDLKEVNL